jgi:membrane protein YqaA with SNARE-associated domain
MARPRAAGNTDHRPQNDSGDYNVRRFIAKACGSWESNPEIGKAGLGVLQRLSQYLLLWGIPGLMAISFFDSAAVPMMGGPDFVVLLFAWRRPMQCLLIVLAAAIGSTLGCLVLYRVGRAGGEMALARFSPERRAWAKEKLDRNVFLAVAAGVAAPPPFPTKFVILAAGAFRVRQSSFANGVLAGRLVRYSVIAYLGARFGDQAANILKEHSTTFGLVLAGILALFLLWRHFRGREKTAGSGK